MTVLRCHGDKSVSVPSRTVDGFQDSEKNLWGRKCIVVCFLRSVNHLCVCVYFFSFLYCTLGFLHAILSYPEISV